MQPKGKHEEIISFLATEFTLEFRRLNLAYFIPKQALVKVPNNETGYYPDVLILNRNNLANESLWDKYFTVQTSLSIPLVVEITSSNWRDDYLTKLILCLTNWSYLKLNYENPSYKSVTIKKSIID